MDGLTHTVQHWLLKLHAKFGEKLRLIFLSYSKIIFGLLFVDTAYKKYKARKCRSVKIHVCTLTLLCNCNCLVLFH